MKILGVEAVSASAPESGENDEYSFPTSKGSGDGSERGRSPGALRGAACGCRIHGCWLCYPSRNAWRREGLLEITVDRGELIILSRRKPIEVTGELNNHMNYITFLGPAGATFSHDAYTLLSEIYLVPRLEMGADSNCIPASANGEILGLIARHGGYGTIAMETLAEGRVAEPLESFIDLLRSYKDIGECPFHVIGAIGLQLHFCLMARKGMSFQSIRKIIAHPKALGACKDRLASTSIPTMSVASNGEAARLVAEQEDYTGCAALGPKSASDKYSLDILNEAFEDQEAITTFFLIAPKKHKVAVGENYEQSGIIQSSTGSDRDFGRLALGTVESATAPVFA